MFRRELKQMLCGYRQRIAPISWNISWKFIKYYDFKKNDICIFLLML